jgi:exopolysaccharide biosynthesis polyprenyl glycosylphosphotransferase
MIFGQGKTALDLSHQVKQQLPQVKVCIWPTAAIPWPVADIASPSPRYLHPALVELAPDVALISSSAGTDREVALLAMHLAPFDIDVLVDAPRRGQHTTGEVLTFAGLSCVRLFPKPLKRHQRLVKRAFDIVVGLILLLLLLPLLAVIALLVKIDSRGPILFRQPRVGEHGAHFTIWKFRTMHDNAADKFARNATVINDPRLTRIGAVLRKTSLDELPQLVNVLLGSMSLVGPRPHAMNGDNFSSVMANYAARHRVKPGITGLAQVRGWRGPTDTSVQIEQRVANDLRYIGEWSLNNDVAIIARTFFALCGKNAF